MFEMIRWGADRVLYIPKRKEVAVPGGILFNPSEGAANRVLFLQEPFIHTSVIPLKLFSIMVPLLLALQLRG